MYQNNYMKPSFNASTYKPNMSDDRFIGGGFLGPFILGGITGGLLAPAFYPRPIVYGPVYRPYPIYPNQYVGPNYPIY